VKKDKEEKRKEAEAQRKLQRLGRLCGGLRWVKRHGGYRCAGGSHLVSDTSLALGPDGEDKNGQNVTCAW
jgi:hypothetical protein